MDFESLKDSNGKVISSYWPYNYFIYTDQKLLLKNTFYEKSQTKGIPINLKPAPLTLQYKSPVELSYIGNRIHIFFNLKPSLQCISESESSDKICKVSYLLNEFAQHYSDLKNKNFFSEYGVQAYLSCSDGIALNSDQETGECPCSEKPVFSQKGMELECVFQKDQKGSLSIHLETNNPYIYFLNTDVKHDKELQSYKKTPVKVLEIN